MPTSSRLASTEGHIDGAEGCRVTIDYKRYHVWNHRKWQEGDEESEKPSHDYIEGYDQVPAGDYLVDDEGVVRYRIDSTKLRMKFGAPKTQVMGVIINGLLKGRI